MDSCDVLIVGGGPAGSSCAWKLVRSGLDVLVLDKQKFPRDKVCGGWITPAVLQELQLEPDEYARERVFQPIRGFRTSCMGIDEVETRYAEPVSYGIRRFEFDCYLLARSGARLLEGVSLTSLEKCGDRWVADKQIETPMVVGAGGHFCPVARFMGARHGGEPIVAAQETEFQMDAHQQVGCSIRPEIPELFFCQDMKGYGWCFRKGDYLNIGLGRLDRHRLSAHVTNFVEFLERRKKIGWKIRMPLPGYAYLLYGLGTRNFVGDGVLLIGDAAGLAYWQSGEGIRPAIESGLLAAEAILASRKDYRRASLESYPAMLASHFGRVKRDWTTAISQFVPASLASLLARKLLATRWFSRHVLLDRWFLHSHQRALNFC